MSTEEFGKWADSRNLRGTSSAPRAYARMGWQARQPEIDALKSLNRNYSKVIDEQNISIDAIAAEVEKLRADAELAAESYKYFLQGKRGYVGNDMLFWPTGGGYTTDLRKAEVFTLEAAMKQHLSRDTDIPWPAGYLYSKSRPAVDMRYVSLIAAMKEIK